MKYERLYIIKDGYIYDGNTEEVVGTCVNGVTTFYQTFPIGTHKIVIEQEDTYSLKTVFLTLGLFVLACLIFVIILPLLPR